MNKSAATLVAVVAVVLAVVLAGVPAAEASVPGIGDRLLRVFGPFYKNPLTSSDAVKSGWHQYNSTCDPTFGYCYAKARNGPSHSKPFVVCYTAAGQLSAFGVYAFDQEAGAPLVPALWQPEMTSDGAAVRSIISTRNVSSVCTQQRFDAPIGDRLSINGNFEVPVTQSAAEDAGWLPGNCIPRMGTHHSYNLNPSDPFAVESMVPVIPMYNPADGKVAAVLFEWPYPQKNGLTGPWEGPFGNNLFCANWCKDSGCSFGDDVMSSMHWLFGDPSSVKCAGAKCII